MRRSPSASSAASYCSPSGHGPSHGPTPTSGGPCGIGSYGARSLARHGAGSTLGRLTHGVGYGRYAGAVSLPWTCCRCCSGIDWLDPEWLLDGFGGAFIWVSLVIVFVECGLFFPFLPGDTLLFALGLFIAGDDSTSSASSTALDLVVAIVAADVAAFLGNVVGYEIGRKIGPPLYERDGRILKRKYFDKTSAFFEKHGNKALVIGRFVPFVRTYITVIAGVTEMDRRRFFIWSAVGAVLWVVSASRCSATSSARRSRRSARTSTTRSSRSWRSR